MALEQPHNIPVDGSIYGLKKDQTYKLSHDYTYQWEHKGQPYRLKIKKGFLYDGASIPRGLWTVSGLRPDGLLRAAATIHDFLYEYKGDLPRGSYQKWEEDLSGWINLNHKWSRKASDKMFARLLREAGVSKIRRRMAYYAVRSPIGWLAWKT